MTKFIILSGLALAARGQTGETFATAAAQQAFVDKTCAGCHNDKLKSGGFTWTKVDLAHPEKTPAAAESAIRMLKAGMMPPPGIPRPPAATMKAFTRSLEDSVDRGAAVHPNAGAPALHRLNRTEYHNAIRDLLALDVEVGALLPPDDMSHGFDNMADVLNVSPTLMEGYIRAASKISREAVGDLKMAALTKTYHIPRVVSQMRHVEGTPFGTRGGLSVMHSFPVDGEYVFRMSLYYDICGPLWGKNQGKGQQIEVSVDGIRAALMTIDPNSVFTDDLVSIPVKVTAGPKRVSAAFIPKFSGPVEDTVMPFGQSLIDFNNADMPGITSLPHLRELRIVGPKNVTGVGDTPSRRKIFACHPASASEEVTCAKKIINVLARQAYRRPVRDGDLEDLLSVYQQTRNKTDFESGIRDVVQSLIADPEFIFRFERTPASAAAGSNYRISDLELASRLSFFLWSSVPDEELIAIASQGKLKEPAVLEKQVRRMLDDPKSEAISKVFAAQWMQLQNLNDVQPDAFLFPNFDKNVAESMRRETELFFDSMVHEDRGIVDLLTANYTFVDEVLAKHYGMPNVMGPLFRRVEWKDPNRFGLLGQGSMLTLTSNSNRTSPVNRGKWVMLVLLGTPPPPPPPNVPLFKETGENEKPMSVRATMELHRKNEPCRSCHQLMDPIGLALENFDAVGVWRTKDAGLPVDANGKMFDGTKLDGPISLRNALLAHTDAFTGNFTEKLLSYALGRVIDTNDMPMVRSIDREAARDNYKFSSYVLGVVRSLPFQMRRADSGESSGGH